MEDTVYATADDLALRWRPLDDGERAKATALLADASDFIRTQAGDLKGISDTTLKRICCDVVKRAMVQDAAAGMTQHSETVGSVTESTSYTQPSAGIGGFWLTDEDKIALGISGTHMFSIDMGGE